MFSIQDIYVCSIIYTIIDFIIFLFPRITTMRAFTTSTLVMSILILVIKDTLPTPLLYIFIWVMCSLHKYGMDGCIMYNAI